MNNDERRKLSALEKRLKFLEERIASGESENKVFTYDKQEASALRWALLRLQDNVKYGTELS